MSVRRPCRLGAFWVRGLVGLALLAAQAEAQPVAGAPPTAATAPLSIWYRSSEGCPEGSVFVARLAELGRHATLARVGDRVDFVVTVARTADASSGRLERQTARGTVAIRELDAARCDEVTEALALSLEIALDPENDATSNGAALTSNGAALTSNGAALTSNGEASSDAGEAPMPLPPPAQPLAAADQTPDMPASDGARRGPFAIGAQGSLTHGIAPRWAPGGALFAELRSRDASALAGRFSLGAALANDTLSAIDVDVFWLAGRVEGCAFELRSGALSVQPCAGAELGLVRADSSGDGARGDAGSWAAALGVVRASAQLDEHFALEAQLSAGLPFVRYAVGSSLGGDLFRTGAVTPALAVGGRWAP